MRIGIINEETWGFFNEIYAELSEHHQVSVFRPRIRNLPVFRDRLNRTFSRRDWLTFLNQQDVIFCEWASESLATITHLPKVTKIVTRLHRYELYHWADKVNWDAVDRIIFVSEMKSREFAQQYPSCADRSVVIPVGIDYGKFQQEARGFRGNLGILCHITPRKRVYELVLAFYELTRMNPGYHLHIGGGEHPRFKDYYQAIHHLVRKLGLSDQVTLYGNVGQAQEWYSNIDVFISNSYSEALQVAPMESIAAGCYCFSHHWEGAEELLPGENLFLTERSLLDLIEGYSSLSESEQKEKIRNLQALVRERFDVNKIKVNIRNLVEEVAAERFLAPGER